MKLYIRLSDEADFMKVDSWDYDIKEEAWFGIKDGVKYDADYVIRIEDNEMYYVEVPAEAKLTEDEVADVDASINAICEIFTAEELDYYLHQLQELKHRGAF